MGFFNPAEFAAQCQVPQSQLADFSEDDDTGWYTQHGKEAESPSVGRKEISAVQCDNVSEGATATGGPGAAHDVSVDPVQSSGQGDIGKEGGMQRGEAEEQQEGGDEVLEPLPSSPGGLAPTDLLGSEVPRAVALDVNARPAEAMPLTQAPDMHDFPVPSQDPFHTQETPEKAGHSGGIINGGSHREPASQKTTMFGKGLRAVLSPFGIGRLSGIFGDKGRDDGQKRSSQAAGSQHEGHVPPLRNTVPATPVSPSQEGTGPMSSLSSSPRGAAVRQGLDLIEQAHQLGGAKLKLATQGVSSLSGSGKDTASAGAAAGMTDAHPLVVDDAEGPVTAQVDVNGQAVNAILLQPVTAEAAKEAASHQIVAPSGVPAGADCIAVAPILAPESDAQQQMPLVARPSRKRMEPGADAPGPASLARDTKGSSAATPEVGPRQQKRRLLTGMAVVWRYFGLKDPKTPQAPTG